MKTFSITDAGAIREMNQDFYFSSDTAVGNLPNLFIVADGMGGHKAGDYASRYTIERVVASVSRNAGDEPVSIIKEAINKANELLVAESREDVTDMYTRITASLICSTRSIRRICALLRRAVTVLPAVHIRVHISGIF